MKAAYWEKLRDPRWQKLRLKIMERDGFTCRRCCETELPLNVHHGYYEKGLEPWEYHPKTLWTLCEECHRTVHEFQRKIYRQIAEIEPQFADETLLKVIRRFQARVKWAERPHRRLVGSQK